jgi:hypothetical protein
MQKKLIIKNHTIMKRIIYILISLLPLSACTKSTDMNSTGGNQQGATGNGYDGGSGQGGSLARFTIANDHLYIVDDRKLYTYTLANDASPQVASTLDIGEDIETIYSYNDMLFIGSRNAMYVYSISDATHPSRLGTASHVRSCDPVVASGNTAYVTLRNGNTCGGTESSLMVYDISKITSPSLKNTITMESPYGLGIRNSRLYVCNGSNGLNVYNIAFPNNPQLKKQIKDDVFYDVIATDDLLICMVQGGMALYAYDYTQELVRLAKISN